MLPDNHDHLNFELSSSHSLEKNLIVSFDQAK